MEPRFILTEYVARAMTEAVYEQLEDSSYSGRIPQCTGVLVFADSPRACEHELRSVLEDWLLAGLKLGHPLPVIAGIDLNRAIAHEPVDAL
jgi:predicted RNase H-like HicB family nuclease